MSKLDPPPLPPPRVAPTYLLAAAVIWATAISSLLAPPTPAAPARYAVLRCYTK
jgi:hypothetical protein